VGSTVVDKDGLHANQLFRRTKQRREVLAREEDLPHTEAQDGKQLS
jgi:hypothetical protein